MPSKTKKACLIELVQFTTTGDYCLEMYSNLTGRSGKPVHRIPLLEYEAKELERKLKIDIQRKVVPVRTTGDGNWHGGK